jgi:hypothetical protein
MIKTKKTTVYTLVGQSAPKTGKLRYNAANVEGLDT